MIRNILSQNFNPTERCLDDDNVTLVFALDSGYIEPLRVLLTSMALSNSFIDSPVTVFTSDKALLNNRFIYRLADRLVILDGEIAERIGKIETKIRNRTNAKREGIPDFRDWTKGTLLKWASFQDLGTEMVLFLDADMIFIDNARDLLTHYDKDSIVGVPQFVSAIYRDAEGEKYSNEIILQNLRSMLERGKFGPEPRPYSLNSGVMLIGRNLRSPQFFDEALEFVARSPKTYINEQNLLNSYITSSRYHLRLIGARYNFHEEFLNSQPPSDQIKLLSKIAILHHAGPIKPWNKNISPDRRLAQMLWWKFQSISASNLVLSE